ncbi:adenosylcobinamide-GDP ribazoletransferase [Streptomyces griseocarneus]|uniref:adenosylcobinamide-GDP ribazoletransferase n=1 Tax=Streptomyces griseocarneus TaxID=51201 RepID=UPI00167DBD22|nr:adenosylcobinamide-GDP ribazoletransferase [Streptomyces griseocarneus]MBZ6472064.1 adenosylcobinamide-GDP ribazoletransferase [Streptomyces griseocarneus]
MTDTTTARASLGDALRFAFGTLTVLPVPLTRWDRPAARGGMLAAPLAGLVVGGCAAAASVLLLLLGAGPALAAVAAVATGAVLTRGLHLDGLADVADGLGSGKPAEDALRVMKRSDIGPFGVVTLLLTLLAQVAVLAQLYAASWTRGAVAAVVAALAARCALTLAARAGVPAARPEGLGAAVAGVVPVRAAWAVAALGAAAAAGASACTADGPFRAAQGAAAVLLALAAAESLLRRCRRRFGGVTGDVFGALAETAATCALVVLALG